MFGISGTEFLLIAVVAIVLLGPKHAAQALAAVRNGIRYVRDFSARMREQYAKSHAQVSLEDLGISEEDLAALRELRASTGTLDPRAYVKRAVAEEMDAWLDMTPAPVRRATNLPSSGKGKSFEEARKAAAAKREAAAAAEAAAKASEAGRAEQAGSESVPATGASEAGGEVASRAPSTEAQIAAEEAAPGAPAGVESAHGRGENSPKLSERTES